VDQDEVGILSGDDSVCTMTIQQVMGLVSVVTGLVAMGFIPAIFSWEIRMQRRFSGEPGAVRRLLTAVGNVVAVLFLLQLGLWLVFRPF
jgi:hypothetical protein